MRRYSKIDCCFGWSVCCDCSANPRKKVIFFAHIYVEIDLNNPLSDSLEKNLGSSSWIQHLDYESLPFHFWVCHECGHLQHQCPRVSKNVETFASGYPPPSVPKSNKGDKGMAHV